MLRLILVVVVLTIIMCNPFLLFLGAAVGLAWLLFTRPNSFTWLGDKAVKEPEEKRSVPKKEYPTVEEIYAREVESRMKPGYKDDPKWKALNKKVRAHNDKRAEIDVQEDKLEELTNEVI